MEKKERETALIKTFKNLGLNKETTIGLMTFLNTDEKQEEMIDYLLLKRKKGEIPTEQGILRELGRILGV